MVVLKNNIMENSCKSGKCGNDNKIKFIPTRPNVPRPTKPQGQTPILARTIIEEL